MPTKTNGKNKRDANDEMRELRSLVMEIAKQNIALGQRIDTVNQQLGQRIDMVGQRIDMVNQQLGQRIDGMIQQNVILCQRLDLLGMRMDENIKQTHQQQLEVARIAYDIQDSLSKLPDAIREQIGFSKKK